MKMRFVMFSFIIAAGLLSGCASGPKFAEVRGTLPPMGSDKGRIYIYRASVLGAAIQPDVRVNGEVVGSAKPKGFILVDRPAGQYKIATSTEVERTLSLTLANGETKYVRLGISMGFMVGHVYPELVEAAVGEKELKDCSYLGGK